MNAAALGIAAGRWVLWNSGGAAVLVVLILIVQRALGHRISARWRHNLWLLVVVRLMLPAIPVIHVPMPAWANFRPSTQEQATADRPQPSAPPVVAMTPVVRLAADDPIAAGEDARPTNGGDEVSRYAPNETQGIEPIAAQPVAASNSVATTPVEQVAAASPPPVTVQNPVMRWPVFFLMAWLAGSAVVLSWLVCTSVRLWRATRSLQPVADAAIVELLADCCRAMAVTNPPALLAGPDDSFGPALVGAWRPRLILPARVLREFGRHELRLIVSHELAHLRRGDVAANYLLAALQTIHWFNPLVWIAFARLRAERELACDEAVLDLAPARERLTYGCTILKLLEAASRPHGIAVGGIGAVGVIQHKALMHRRIAMIAKYDGKRSRGSVIAVALSLMVGAAALATVATVAVAQEQPAQARPTTPGLALDGARTAVEAAAAKPDVPGNPEVRTGRDLPAALPTQDGLRQRAENDAPTVPQAGPETNARSDAMGPPAMDLSARTVEDPTAVQANTKTADKLKRSLPLKSNGLPLREVLSTIARAGGLDIVIDDKALGEGNIDSNSPVMMELNEPRPLEQILQMSLRLVSPNIDYSILDGVVFVSSRAELSRHAVTRVYDIGNADHSEVSNLLINGTGLVTRVSYVGSKLVVTASELTQRHVARLLAAVGDQLQDRPNQPRTSNRGHDSRATRIYALKFAEASGMKPLVLAACSPNVTVAADPRTNSLLIVAAADDQKLAESLIQQLDQPAKPDKVGQNTDGLPEWAAKMLDEMRVLSERAAVLGSQQVGNKHPEFVSITTRLEAMRNELDRLKAQLAKEGNDAAARQLDGAMEQISSMFTPATTAHEPAQPATAR